MKKVTIINQNKGGVGKSFLTALILEKEKKAGSNFIIIDIDSGNRSTFKRFSENEDYAQDVSIFSLLKGDSIDKGLFSEFFEKISVSDKDVFYLDLGGNESREILSLFNTIGIDNVVEFFKSIEVDVKFLTVVKAGDRDCIDHLKNVSAVAEKDFKHICMVNSNSYDEETDDNYNKLVTFCKKNKISVRSFGKAPAGKIADTISDYVRLGFKGSLGMFKGIFVGMVENLNIND